MTMMIITTIIIIISTNSDRLTLCREARARARGRVAVALDHRAGPQHPACADRERFELNSTDLLAPSLLLDCSSWQSESGVRRIIVGRG